MPIIEVKNLTKEYNLGALTSIKDTVRHSLARLTRKQTWTREKFKALDDVSFSIEEGEVVGIIGHNGAGKSTLLKHLAHITNPTSGEVIVRGNVAPLIEVGAGLNPELTGRENIFLNGAILGIPKKVINKKLDEIIVFSELEQFIDTPVKRYSSGMIVKLGFSIATSMDADILIIDEVLAVGDLAFQRKCFERMEDLIKRQNKTVLLVSHNIRQVERLCTRVMLLDGGCIEVDGDPAEVTDLFYRKSNAKVQNYHSSMQGSKDGVRSSGEVELLNIDIVDDEDKITDVIKSGEKLRVRVYFNTLCKLEKPEIVVGTHRTDFVYITAGSTAIFDDRPDYLPGEHMVEYIIPLFPVVGGVYGIRFGVFDQYRRTMFYGETLKVFTVLPGDKEAKQAGLRMLDLPTVWNLNGLTYRSESIM